MSFVTPAYVTPNYGSRCAVSRCSPSANVMVASDSTTFGNLPSARAGRSPLTVYGFRTPAARSRATRGFSLLEMIVATTLLSLAIVGLLGVIRTSLANAVRVKEYDRVAMLARSTMSEILVSDPLPVPGRLSGRYDDQAGWEAVIKPYELPIRPRRGGVMVAGIQLTIWWRSDGLRKTQVFNGFQRVRITPDHMRSAAFR